MKTEPANVNNETFVSVPVSVPPTPSIPTPPVSASPHLDSTFQVAVPTKGNKKASIQLPKDSIMTEDLSMAQEEEVPVIKSEPMESPPRKPTATTKASAKATASAKKAHEIFK